MVLNTYLKTADKQTKKPDKMKNRHIIPSVAISLLALTAVTGCSDEAKYDFDGSNDNLVYIAPRNVDHPFECEVMTTPAGVFGRVAADLSIKTQYTTSDSIRVTAKVNTDAALVEQYNTAHATTYRLPSAEILQAMKVTPSGVGAGKNQSSVPVTVALDDKKIEAFRTTDSEAPGYLIPVSLLIEGSDGKGGDRPYGLTERYNTAYIVVKTSKADYLTSIVGENVIASNIIKTPAGVYGGISASVKIQNLIAVTGDMQGTFVADNSLVAEYNSSHGTSFSPLPDNVLSTLTVTPAVIRDGETESEEGIRVSAPDQIVQQLEGAYLLPLRLKTTFANGAKVDEDDIVYLTIETKSQLINDDAESIPGSLADISTATVVSADNLNPDEYSQLFIGGWNAMWPFLEQREDASFTIDLGEEKSLTAFYSMCYGSEDTEMLFSTDNITWTSAGTTNGHRSIYDEDYNRAYVLYEAVKCRYVKFQYKLDPTNWSWNYGYAGVWEINLWFN